ncbi:MAG: aldehyde dehydrogenase family protein [Verrucomicrobiales bacterium]
MQPPNLPHIPVFRAGLSYASLDVAEITAVGTNEPVVRISQANSGLIRRDLRAMGRARTALGRVRAKERVAITKRAGELFLQATLPLGDGGHTQSPDDYLFQLASTSGLPHTLIRRNMSRLAQVFAEIDVILNGLTRGLDLDVLDRGFGEQHGSPVSYSLAADSLGVILPSNSPAVNALWIPCIALGVPVVLKPGREEPWTPWRVIQAFIAAGCPAEAFGFFPTSHEGSSAIIRSAGRVMLFGDDKTVGQYSNDPRVEVHGSGRSKVLIGEDKIEQWRDFLPLLVESVAANSGRSCINASAIIVPSHGDEIAEAVAKELLGMVPRAPDDKEANLSGFANAAMAEMIDAAIEDGLTESGACDVSRKLREGMGGPFERRASRDGMNYLLPTVVRCDSFGHGLANREFLFPYCSVVEVPQAEMIDAIGPSLVVTVLTDDPAWITQLLSAPHIDRLNIGDVPTSKIDWSQPHEGNLFEFLYKRRSVSVAPALA